MTAVALPAIPKEAAISQALLDNSAMLNPPLGGAAQRVARLGSRFQVKVQLPVLSDTAARAMIAAQLQAEAEARTLSLTWPQVAAASLGTPVVNLGSQAGTVLNVKGLTAGVAVPQLTFFSFVANGRNYLHVTTAAVSADGSGHAALAIAPMIRFSPADLTALEMVNPVIEGFLDAGAGWTLDRLKWRQTSFTLTENE